MIIVTVMKRSLRDKIMQTNKHVRKRTRTILNITAFVLQIIYNSVFKIISFIDYTLIIFINLKILSKLEKIKIPFLEVFLILQSTI